MALKYNEHYAGINVWNFWLSSSINEASSEVLEGLRKLEYRGYDSAGLAAIFPGHEEDLLRLRGLRDMFLTWFQG